MFKNTTYDNRVKIADTVLNNDVYKEIGDQLVELNRQFSEIGQRRETYSDIRDFIRNKILMTDNAPKRIEIYAVLFNSLAQSLDSYCEACEDSFNKTISEEDSNDVAQMNNID